MTNVESPTNKNPYNTMNGTTLMTIMTTTDHYTTRTKVQSPTESPTLPKDTNPPPKTKLTLLQMIRKLEGRKIPSRTG